MRAVTVTLYLSISGMIKIHKVGVKERRHGDYRGRTSKQ